MKLIHSFLSNQQGSGEIDMILIVGLFPILAITILLSIGSVISRQDHSQETLSIQESVLQTEESEDSEHAELISSSLISITNSEIHVGTINVYEDEKIKKVPQTDSTENVPEIIPADDAETSWIHSLKLIFGTAWTCLWIGIGIAIRNRRKRQDKQLIEEYDLT